MHCWRLNSANTLRLIKGAGIPDGQPGGDKWLASARCAQLVFALGFCEVPTFMGEGRHAPRLPKSVSSRAGRCPPVSLTGLTTQAGAHLVIDWIDHAGRCPPVSLTGLTTHAGAHLVIDWIKQDDIPLVILKHHARPGWLRVHAQHCTPGVAELVHEGCVFC